MSVIVENDKDELEWSFTSLSDVEGVRGLLRLRSHYDHLHSNNEIEGLMGSNVDLNDQLEEVTCTYAWLDDIISKANLTEQQSKVVDRYTKGFSVEEIAIQDGQTARNINGILNTVCRKVSSIQQREWEIWIHRHKLKSEFKKCVKCETDFPLNEKFFRAVDLERKAFRGECRICEASRRKS